MAFGVAVIAGTTTRSNYYQARGKMNVLFTKKECPKCVSVKQKLDRIGADYKIMDAQSKEGMARLAYVQKPETDFPTLIIDNETVISGVI